MSELITFLKFGSLSGAGWLIDFALLMILVGGFGAPTFAANAINSSVAALGVFLVSRRFVFARAEGGLEIRVAAYLAYTLCMIVVAAEAMSLIVEALRTIAEARGWRANPSLLTALAKVAVTPPLLTLNFLMSRHTAERKLPTRAWS